MKKILLCILFAHISTLGFSQAPNYVPANGLVGWWPFNGNANDESGNGNNGTVNGASLTSDRNGVANKAYSFDGIDDYINVLFSSSLHGQTGTINVWIKTNGIFTNQKSIFSQSSGRPQLVAESQGEGGNQSSNSAAINWKATNGLFPCAQSNSAVDISEWLMITANYSTDSFKIYINGVNETITNTSLTQDNCSQNDFQIGGFYQTNSNCGSSIGFSQMFDGFIDDIGIWNRALTACEIQNLYTSTNPSNTTTATACNSYAWNGTTYTSSGVYTDTSNCVTESLNLTINQSTSSSISQTALDSYTWPVNNQTYTTTGAYTAVIPNAAGCDSTITLNLTMSFTGINDLSASKLSIYPNPTNGDFTITGLELVGTVSSLSLTDMNDKVVKVLDTKATKFSMASIKPGVYFLNILSGNKEEVLKIVKE